MEETLIYLKDAKESCEFGKPQYHEVEEGAFAIKKVRAAFYNEAHKSWLAITEHCYGAAMAGFTGSNCQTLDEIGIYDIPICTPKK
ncbi:MAG: hypothetical protein ACXWRE_07555 [Pseudobdellovibrionaceae bacterium]